MKKLLPIALLALLVAACGKSTAEESDLEKANALLQSQYPEIAQLGTITQLDSLFDVEESLALRAEAAQCTRSADSLIQAALPLWNFLQTAGKIQECEELANATKDKAVALIKKAYDLQSEADYKAFEVMAFDTQVSTLPFAGYEATIKNDSLKFNIYFNKKVNKILYIEGSWSYVFDKRLNN